MKHQRALSALDELAKQAPMLALQPTAPALAEQVAQLAHDIRAMIDLPDDTHRHLGPCDRCGKPLYAQRGAMAHACTTPGCTMTYNVERRIAQLLRQARDVVASPATIATALTSLDQPVTEERIWKWRERGKLTPRSLNGPRRQPWYRIGDVLDLLDDDARRELTRANKKNDARTPHAKMDSATPDVSVSNS